MKCSRWLETRDGALTRKALEERLREAQYEISYLEMPGGAYQSAHSHPDRRAEAVLTGELRVTAGDDERVLGPGDVVTFSRGEVHSLEVLSSEPAGILEGASSEPTEPWPTVRMISLAVLLVLINFWSQRHLGFEIPDLLLVNAIVVLLPQVLRFLDPREQLTIERFFRHGLWYLAKIPTLAVLALGLLIAVSFWSSIEVQPEPGGNALEVSIWPQSTSSGVQKPAGSAALADASSRQLLRETERFLLPSLPVGRDFRLFVEGYFGKAVKLKPWRQKKVAVASLDPLPSIWIRLPLERLDEGGWIDIKSAGKLMMDPLYIKASQGSVLLGAIPDPATLGRWRLEWRSELGEEEGITSRQESQLLQMWSTPARFSESSRIDSSFDTLSLDHLLVEEVQFDVEFRSLVNESRATAKWPVAAPAAGTKVQYTMEHTDG